MRGRTGRCRASTAARPRRRSPSSGPRPGSACAPTGSPSTSAPSSATRRRGPARSRSAATVFAALREHGLDPWLLDLGGGFPARLDDGCPPPEAYGAAIERHLAASFGDQRPTTIAEPGRGIAADAGVLVTTVVAVLHRAGTRWVFLDAGVFTGLVETLDEAIRYPLATDVPGPTGPCVLAGPTCDSADVLYEARSSSPWPWPRATRSGSTAPASTPRRTPRSASTASLRWPRSSTRERAPRSRPVGRLLTAYGCGSLATGLPWPLLLVLVWDQYGDGPHGAWAVGLAGAARMAPYVLLSWAIGSLGDHVRRDRLVRATMLLRLVFLALAAVAVAHDRVGLGIVAAALAVTAGHADLSRDRGLDAAAGRARPGPRHRAAGHHRGRVVGRRPGAGRAAADPADCGRGPSSSSVVLAGLGLAFSTGISLPGPVEKAPDAVAGMLRAVASRRPAVGRPGPGRAAQPRHHGHRRRAAAAEHGRVAHRRLRLRDGDRLPGLRRPGRTGAGPAGHASRSPAVC